MNKLRKIYNNVVTCLVYPQETKEQKVKELEKPKPELNTYNEGATIIFKSIPVIQEDLMRTQSFRKK